MKVPQISRPPETYNYLDKFTLLKGDKVVIRPKSYYIDADGAKHSVGVTGTYIFSCAVNSGILVRELDLDISAGTFVYLGEDRFVESTGTYLKAHILSLPKPAKPTKVKKVKKQKVKK